MLAGCRSREDSRTTSRGGVVLLALALLPAVAGSPSRGAAQELPDLDDVLDHLDDLYRSTSSHAVMTMTVVRDRGERSLSLESWSQGTEEALIVIRAPAREAGTATLRTDDGLWNYAPRADRMIRIPSGLMSESWMGSHFTNDDLLRETSYREDYGASLDRVEEEGVPYLRVTLTPHPEAPVVYTRLDFFLTEEWIPVRWDYIDGDEVVRQIFFDRVERVADRELPLRLVIRPTDAPEERTEIFYELPELEVDLDRSMFTRQGLRRVVRD